LEKGFEGFWLDDEDEKVWEEEGRIGGKKKDECIKEFVLEFEGGEEKGTNL
jgi:hypothetical protein